ncbi:MAG TPA: DUF177 domain-containing protein [Bacteroidia bacterium]|nr:DUF177 domain-containing protein [Bacteroidia bacterium]
MAKIKDLVIPFSGMKEGNYSFSVELGDTFFESLEFSEIKKGEIKVEIEMVRGQNMLNLDIAINGNVELICDRCGNTYPQPIEDERAMVVNIDADHFEDEDDLISLPSSYNDLDLTQYIYEYISLAVPAKLVCPDNIGCDPDVISKLDQLKPGEQSGDDQPTDPRWDALKNLKDNN